MRVDLIDGTYELFRHHHGAPSRSFGGREVGGVRGVAASVLGMLADGATHVAVATDHVIESFRNDLFSGYKTGAGIPSELREQFEPLESLLRALGIPVYAMVEFEADDALAGLAAAAADDPAVDRVLIHTPDKDLAQCVQGKRVVQSDRRRGLVRDEDGVRERFGVEPRSIPDLLALVGDSADGIPGLPGWGERSTAAVLARYGHIEDVPRDHDDWDVSVRGAARLAAALRERRDEALLYRTLATLRPDAATLPDGVDALRWRGPAADAPGVAAAVGAPDLATRARALAG